MTYRKFRADYLFTGREMAESDAILITTQDGTIQDLLPAAEAGEGIEHLRGLLSPGFINCHCHLELSHMKGLLPERTGLVDFLLAVMRQRNPAPTGGLPVAGGGSTGPGVNPAEAAGPIQEAITAAELSMVNGGIVAVGDICNTTHTLAQKAAGRLYYHNFIETMGFVPNSAPDRFENSRKVFDAFAGLYATRGEPGTSTSRRMIHVPEAGRSWPGSLVPVSLAPHAPYSVSPPLCKLIADFPGNRLLTIHNQESEAENTFYLTGGGDFLRLYGAMGLDTSFFRGTGKRSLESYLPYFRGGGNQTGQRTGKGAGQETGVGKGTDLRKGADLDPGAGIGQVADLDPGADLGLGAGVAQGADSTRSLILVHNVDTNEEDLRFAMEDGHGDGQTSLRLFFCLCPNANLYIGGKLPDVELLIRRKGVPVIGTDSLASNHQLSILEELKTLQRQFPQLSTPTLLTWATANGAEALGMEDKLGSFQPGKKPGLVLIEGLEGTQLKVGTTARRVL